LITEDKYRRIKTLKNVFEMGKCYKKVDLEVLEKV
jgi:hypothetical protein